MNISMMLRDYQIEMLGRVVEALAGHRSVMVQMPTGTGKAVWEIRRDEGWQDDHTTCV